MIAMLFYIRFKKTQIASEITKGWISIHARLHNARSAPKHHILDNEASKEIKKALCKKDNTHQSLPPYIHIWNTAERAICTFKSHLCARLATLDPNYPMSQWERFSHQDDESLNLLNISRVNLNLSSDIYLLGTFVSNKNSLHHLEQKHWYISDQITNSHGVIILKRTVHRTNIRTL